MEKQHFQLRLINHSSEPAIAMSRTADTDHPRNPLILKLKFLLLCSLRRDNRPRSVTFLKHFSYKELRRATDAFQLVICRSPSQGCTYQAKLQDGSDALVREITGSDQANKDALFREIRVLGNLHHRHLVQLRGYSIGDRSFLVFDGSGCGSLKDHLNDPLKTPLTWKTRLQIAVGVAAALEYLHLFCYPPIIYQVSISSNNIVLDENFTAKISNISLLHSDPKDCVQQVQRQLISQYGALLLELITGQTSERESDDAIQWVQDLHFDQSIHRMIDPDLGDNYDTKMLRKLLTVARLCVKAGEKPPFSISHVLWYLRAFCTRVTTDRVVNFLVNTAILQGIKAFLVLSTV